MTTEYSTKARDDKEIAEVKVKTLELAARSVSKAIAFLRMVAVQTVSMAGGRFVHTKDDSRESSQSLVLNYSSHIVELLSSAL